MPARALFGSSSIDAPVIYAGVTKFITSYFTGQFSSMFDKLGSNAQKVGSGIQGEFNKAAIAQKNVAEGIASFKAQETLKDLALQRAQDLEQPDTMCQSVSAANVVRAAESLAKFNASQDTIARIMGKPTKRANLDGSASPYLLESTLYSADASRSVLNNAAYTRQNFCTTEDQRRDPSCKVSVSNPEFAGADMNVAFLYLGTDGGSTYTPRQEIAVDAFVGRIVGGIPTETLRDPVWEKSTQGKAYVELTRRAAAFQSMAAFTLNQIKSSHRPQDAK